MRLLSVEPMMAECVENGDNLAEANNREEVDGVCKTPLKRSTKFGAQAMHEQIKRVMKRFGVDLDQGADPKLKCIVSDNTQCNRNLALLLLIPFINCFAHLWALAMSSLTKVGSDFYDFSLARVTNEARRVQKVFKGSSKASSCLKEQTDKVVVLPVVTRWSSNYSCVKRYDEIIDHIRRATIHPDCPRLEPIMMYSDTFKAEIAEILERLEALNALTRILQKRHSRVADDMIAFKLALDQDEDVGFGGIGVDPSYLDLSNPVFANAVFLRGVYKLQMKKANELTEAEKNAVLSLRARPAIRIESGEETGSAEGEDRYARLTRKVKKLKTDPPAEYTNCDFILGTAVEVERLWSLAKGILTDNRRGMSTLMVQTILFLKENRELWTDTMVYDCIGNVKKNAGNERRRKREELLEEQDAMQAALEEASRM